MPIHRVEWPEEDNVTRWGQHTHWVIRADSKMEALELAQKDQNAWGETVSLGELTVEEIPTEGEPTIILWYGPDA